MYPISGGFQELSIQEVQPMRGLAYDGEHLYSCIPSDFSIIILDSKGGTVGRHKTRRPFSSICYDSTRRCFWAVCKESPIYVYKLDGALQEFGRIRLNSHIYEGQTAIACDGQRGGLLGIAENTLLGISESGEITSTVHLLKGTRALTTCEELVITANPGAIQICNDRMCMKQCLYIPAEMVVTGICVLKRTASSIEFALLSRQECYNRFMVVETALSLQPAGQEPPPLKAELPQAEAVEEPPPIFEVAQAEELSGGGLPPLRQGFDAPPLPTIQQPFGGAGLMEQMIIDLLNIFPEL